jgi:hypothetical protein
MIHDKGKIPQDQGKGRRGFQALVQQDFGSEKPSALDSQLYDGQLDDLLGTSPAQTSSPENSRGTKIPESTQEFAKDICARASILTNNAKSPRQIEDAIKGTESAFAKDLSAMIDLFEEQKLAEPVISCIGELRREGLDIISTLTRASSNTFEDSARSNATFADLLKPAELRKLFVLPDNLRASILLGAKRVAETLISSQCFQANLATLGSTTPPKIPGLQPDKPAIAAGTKIMAATYTAIWALFERAVCEVDGVGDSGEFRNVAGLSAFVMRNLIHQLAFCITANLANDASVKPHLPRVLQVIQSIKFSDNPARYSTFSKATPDGEVFLSLLAALKAKVPLESALDLLLNTDELAEILNSIQEIPEDQLLSLSDNEGKARSYTRGMKIMWSSLAEHARISAVELPIKGADYRLRCSGRRKDGYEFFISEQGELNYTSFAGLAPLINLSSVELDLLSHYHPNLRTLGDAATRAVRHARYILKQAEDLVPDLMCRVEELPSSLTIVGEDDAISFLIKGEELGAFLDLFKHNEGQYARMTKSCGYDPDKGVSTLNSQVYTFRVSVEKQDKEDTSEPEVTLMTQEQATLRREVSRLLRERVHNFGQLFEIIERSFELRLDIAGGKGDHNKLFHDSRPWTLSPKFRNPSNPLHIPIAMKMLDSLNIPLEEMKKILQEIKP